MYRFLLLALLFCTTVFWLLGCSSSEDSNNSANNTDKAFFDLKGYIAEQVDALQSLHAEKKITLNGTTETHALDSLDFSLELDIFSDSDINKPAWSDKYQVDSLANGDELRVVYRALDESLRTDSLIVHYKTGKVVNIEIHNLSKNIMYHSQQYLSYVAGKGYIIDTQQKALFFPETFFTINVSLERD